ncbi:BamA/TamA family outer membrane protein [bacterium]
MKQWKKTICCLFMFSAFSACLAAEEDSTSTKGYFIYPVFFYTPETQWAYGAAMTIFSRKPESTRPSSWIPMVVYTQKTQIIAKVTADLYGKDEKWNTYAEFGYYDYPDLFYGIGNQTTIDQKESYTAKRLLIQVSPRYRIRSDLYVGLQYKFMHQSLSELEEEGLLIQGQIPGSQKSQYSGIGGLVSWDTRDNIYFPIKGHYRQLYLSWYGSALGSDYTYRSMTVDLRQYIPVLSKHVLAMQAYSQMNFGTVPFQALPSYGNSQRMRGYYGGRFRDNHFLVLQTEYRFFFSRMIGATVFGGFGDVSHYLKDFQIKNFNYSVGFGFRFCINPKEKLHVRLDFGYGENTSGYYVEVIEAF